MNEKEVTIQGKLNLKGTLSLPSNGKKKHPAILIVAGSGKIDRNGNVTKPHFEFNLYRDLAHLLNQEGFAVLRYDKRGVGESEGNFLTTGMEDLVDDILVCISFLKKQEEVDANRILLFGHSEGSTLITICASRQPSLVQGLILLAGGGERISEALERQRKILFKELNALPGIKGWLIRTLHICEKEEAKAQKFMKKVMNSKEDSIRMNFIPINAKWMREHLQYDVIKDLEQVQCPVFAATGTKDFQADVSKLERLPLLAKGPVQCEVVENMDHGLKKEERPMSALAMKKRYTENIAKPVHPILMEKMKNWLMEHYPM